MKKFVLFSFLLFNGFLSNAQPKVEILGSGPNTSIRGMSIPDNEVIWVSGSSGTVGKSVDGGKTWRWMIVPGFEKKDFRDIHAFDSSTAIVMAIENPGYILKTTDGGAKWNIVFEKNLEGMFLDAMYFKNEKEGICIGDPLPAKDGGERSFYIIKTNDGGNSWTEMQGRPKAKEGEAIFSASGTNISYISHPDYEFAFVTGGMVSNLVLAGRQGKETKISNIPIIQGKESAGCFGMATDGNKRFYCVGGDYKLPKDSLNNFAYSTNAGKTWKHAKNNPVGYRSCIVIIRKRRMIACGTSGVDYAKNGHKKWKNISGEGFNVCMVSPDKKTVFFAGGKGKIGKLKL